MSVREARRPVAVHGALRRLWNDGTKSVVTVGLALAFVTGTISGFAVFLTSYAVKEFPSPIVLSGFRNTLVALALVALLARPGPVREVRRLASRRRLGLLALGLIGGSVPFILFFEGMARVSTDVAPTAAFIHKTMFLWVAVMAVVFLRERLGRGQLAALGLLLLAQMLVAAPEGVRAQSGVALMLGATLLWSVEVIVARRLLGDVSSGLGAAARMAVGAPVLLAYLAATGRIGALAELTAVQWAWGAGTAVVLFAFVTTWYAALKRAPATAVTCVLTIGAPITAALNAVAGRGLPTVDQLAGYVVFLGAAALIAAAAARAGVPVRTPALAPAKEV